MLTGKILLALVIPTSALLFSSAIPPPCLPLERVTETPRIQVSAAKMWVENENVFKGETFLLRFKTPNAPFLGVINPDGKFFYVVFPASESVGKLSPLVDSKIFVRLDRLAIATAEFKADPYTYGVMENQPVFTTSGTYIFILGDNLHTDDPTAIHRVKVRYKNITRPVQHVVVMN